MNYVHTYPNSYIRYKASDMILHIDSDAAYLVAPKAHSRVAGYFHLSDHPLKGSKPMLNGAIHVECKTLRHVVSSAAEAKVAGVFHNSQIAIPIRTLLHALDHPQPPTPVKTDNSTAEAFSNSTLKEKRSKAWGMRLYWIQDRVTNKEFYIYWKAGDDNFVDYFTKHFAPSYHQKIRPTYI